MMSNSLSREYWQYESGKVVHRELHAVLVVDEDLVHLAGGDAAHGKHQKAEDQMVVLWQEEHNDDQEGYGDHSGQYTLSIRCHFFKPPKRLSRDSYSAIADLTSSLPQSGHSLSQKTSSA